MTYIYETYQDKFFIKVNIMLYQNFQFLGNKKARLTGFLNNC